MRRLLILLLLALITGISPAASDKIPATQSQPRILVLGDSLSSGYGIRPDQGWVSLLGQRLIDKSFRYQLINSSISGNTTIDGLNRIQGLLKQYQPEIVVIELGGNDGLRGLSLKAMQQNLSAMIKLSEKAGARVVLTGIKIPPNYGKRYTDAFYNVYLQLVEQYSLTFIPFLLDRVGGNGTLMQQDGLHPTAEAQTIILENAWPHLLEVLKK